MEVVLRPGKPRARRLALAGIPERHGRLDCGRASDAGSAELPVFQDHDGKRDHRYDQQDGKNRTAQFQNPPDR